MKKDQVRSKTLQKFLSLVLAPETLGLVLTFVFICLAYNFYSVRQQNKFDRKTNFIFDVIELIDQKAQDFRFRFRGELKADSNVALVAIDNRSVEDIGRWPWSRDKIAHMIDELSKYGAKGIGFDIIFSEPETDHPEADQLLAASIDKNKDKIVLGTFAENTNQLIPYQDYCRNYAFQRTNGDQLVKLNATFIVNDLSDEFDDLNFSEIFKGIFDSEEKLATEKALKNIFHKPEILQLNQYQKNRLKHLVYNAYFDYCDTWLSDRDPYSETLKSHYMDVFQNSKQLKGLNFNDSVAMIKKLTLSHPILQSTGWLANVESMQNAADYTASFQVEQDSDGSIRNASLFYRTGNKIGASFIPNLSLETYLIATGLQARVEIDKDPANPRQKKITHFSIIDPAKDTDEALYQIPVDAEGRIKMNYLGPAQTFAHLPAKELFSESDTMMIEQNQKSIPVRKADFIKDKIFIVGATSTGIYDMRVTPFQKDFPGPETHLTNINNFLNGHFLQSPPKEKMWMLISLLILGLLLTLGIARFGALAGLAFALGAEALVLAFDSYLFTKKMYVVTTALPFFLILFLYFGMTIYKYFSEERKKQYLKSTFSKYVSPAIVDEILKDPENIALGGTKQNITVFFSDVRGFTTISEKLDPQLLSVVLNKYLTPMTQIVFQNKGTLDKYMGDAVMAFFGAPVAFSDNAKWACRCALQSLEKLKDVQKDIQAELKGLDLPPLDIGIGINSGDMSVGNMGSDTVRSYTVMGDAVNLASRLEGINKEYGTKIIISEFTFEKVKDSFTAREIDWVKVKGKNKPVKIYELCGEGHGDEQTQQFLVSFALGFEFYLQKKFEQAKNQFAQTLKIKNGDSVSELYIKRCEEFIKAPPPDHWDGIFIMKTK